ncbi:MAG: hypothetical protein ACC661_07540, partial [Verrucomicrobiales bacterium]
MAFASMAGKQRVKPARKARGADVESCRGKGEKPFNLHKIMNGWKKGIACLALAAWLNPAPISLGQTAPPPTTPQGNTGTEIANSPV